MITFNKKKSVLPGFGLAMGWTIFYLSLIVLVPLSTLVIRSASLTWVQFWSVATGPRALAAYRLSFMASLVAALINGLFGLVVSWILVRYRFPFRRLADGLVDLPFALPTSVAGIILTTLYAPNGWVGTQVAKVGLRVAYTPLGIIVALVFIGLPFVVRTVQPVLQDLDAEVEEAAYSLGANLGQTFRRVVLPEILPAWITGCALAFARGLGEYGSVVFIAGNMPMKTEVTPLLIMTKLDEFQYGQATSLALVFLLASFSMMLFLNFMQRGKSALPVLE
ncbi:MAG TPA: sulfate ABC transporter permease subunit CysT [Terriglobia bacterium]|nr:sulfate ABC transporter permease subunit CysT [Terriglobia bacterium]